MGKLLLNDFTSFNLDYTLGCGQTFRWKKAGNWWYGLVNDKVFKIRQNGRELIFENISKDFIKNYFTLDKNLQQILSSISRDEHIKQALQRFRGLRIVRQHPWECLISYICATNKNIPGIKRNIEALSQKFGEEMTFEGKKFYAFPTPAKLAKVSLSELKECGLGFRAKYIREIAEKTIQGIINFEDFKEMSYKKAKKKLLRLRGVGHKVADCVLLFSLEKPEAFPVDVWVKRAILKHYSMHFDKEFVRKVLHKKSLSPNEYNVISGFGREYFGEYAGYAQEYLFHYERFNSTLKHSFSF